MTKIYEQHDAAFKLVSAYAVLKDGQHVANVKIKYPRDGAGRLWAYVHWIGFEMVRGCAGGYGYDKTSAAVYDAACKAVKVITPDTPRQEYRALFLTVMSGHKVESQGWKRVLEDVGFTVLNVI